MLVRYGTSPKGKIIRKAVIYTAKDHHINPEQIDPDAKRVIARLKKAGFSAYIVGGAVRDLLTGKKPKDFDIATNAFPKHIRKLFSHSRIIGKRFRLVHIYYHRNHKNKILEVSTFRSEQRGNTNNRYGSIEEDARRRDFTLNALFYCPVKQIIIDYVGGFKDIRERKIRTLASAETLFLEDPVRMIRGIKYSGFTGFHLPLSVTRVIKKNRHELLQCSAARITEEVYKILQSGKSASVFFKLYQLKLLEVILPVMDQFIRTRSKKNIDDFLFWSLKQLDDCINSNPDRRIERGVMLSYLFKDRYAEGTGNNQEGDRLLVAQKFLHKACLPLVPSKREVYIAALILLKGHKRKELKQGGRRSVKRA